MQDVIDCPLAIKGSVETKCSIGSFVDESEYVERKIMQWAAEHQEPQYPTWFEWLKEQGIVVASASGELYAELPCGDKKYFNDMVCPTPRMFTPISVDTAKKLGIEPKEG